MSASTSGFDGFVGSSLGLVGLPSGLSSGFSDLVGLSASTSGFDGFVGSSLGLVGLSSGFSGLLGLSASTSGFDGFVGSSLGLVGLPSGTIGFSGTPAKTFGFTGDPETLGTFGTNFFFGILGNTAICPRLPEGRLRLFTFLLEPTPLPR